MNILIISGVFPPEPLTTALMNYDLALELSKNHNVTVLHPKPTRPIGKNYDNSPVNYPFNCIEMTSYTCPDSKIIGRIRESYSFAKVCSKYIKIHRKEIDVVYNASWQLFGYKVVAKECVKQKIPYIIPIQDIYPETFFTNRVYPDIIVNILSRILMPIDKYYQKNAYKIRTISNEMADYLSSTRGLPRDKYVVVDNWQNDDEYFYKPITNNKIVFGYVGSINGHSNTELLIKAFVKADLHNCEFRIYGGGNHKEACINLVRELGAKNIIFDVVDKKDVPVIQSSVSVLVLSLPLGNGGLCLPSKMVSYMLSGRPILASVEQSATTRYIKEADCGIFVKPDDINALVEGFHSFASMNLNELNRLGYNSRQFAEKKLTRQSNLPIVINEILNAKKNV